MAEIVVARVYDDPMSSGARVLVDRLWPRGLSKSDAPFAIWCKDAAPSTELRRWYGHDPARFDEFRRRYVAELGDPDHATALEQLRELTRAGRLVLLTATRDVPISAATVLAEFLRQL
jgi:uncharacterized protein YeaO (DUF488 family)